MQSEIYSINEPEDIETTKMKMKNKKLQEAMEYKQKLVQLSPFDRTALPREKRVLQMGTIRPLLNMSYLTT